MDGELCLGRCALKPSTAPSGCRTGPCSRELPLDFVCGLDSGRGSGAHDAPLTKRFRSSRQGSREGLLRGAGSPRDGAICGRGPRVLLRLALTLAILLLCAFGPGTRIGEAANPGPRQFNDLDDPFAPADMESLSDDAMEDLPNPPLPGHAQLPDEPMTSFTAAAKFEGARPGYAFRLGASGLGYYLDGVEPASGGELAEDLGNLDEVVSCPLPPSSQGAAPLRPRHKCRGCKPSFVDLISLNSTGRPQLVEAMAYFKTPALLSNDASKPVAVQVGAILGQEHHAYGASWADLQHQAKRAQWRLHGARAVKCDSGKGSAGVCIAARSHIDIGQPLHSPIDSSPPGSAGRVAVAFVNGILRGGVLLVSVYLWHSEGLTTRNMEILHAAGEAIARFGGPWVLAGDFNMTPSELARAHEWLGRTAGDIVAPATPTCRSTCGGRVIDYFIVDRRIMGAVHAVWTDLDFPASPHRAVVLRLRSAATRELVLRLRRPRSLPADRPVGCSRAAAAPDPEVLDALVSASRHCPEAANTAFGHLIDLAEAELCHTCDAVTSEGHPDPRYLGRGRELATFRAPVVPVGTREYGRAGAAVLGLRWVADRLGEMAGMLRAVANGRRPTNAMIVQWSALTSKLQSPAGVLQRLLQEAPETWRPRVAAAGGLTLADTFAAEALRTWGAEARQAARQRARDAAQVAARSWWRWVDEQLRLGAGALHALSKREDIAADVALEGPQGPILSLRHQLEADRAAWSSIWLRFADTATAPWRDTGIELVQQLPWAAPLPPIDAAAVVEASKMFKKRTGLGCDAFHPRWFGWMSTPLLEGFARLLMALEAIGIWPSQIHAILVAQIPKSSGGRRPIGLLPALVRLWEKIRKPVVAAWRCSVERSYNWAAKGRSPQAAVWKQALLDEAAAARGLESAAALVDLVKAFEMVKLELVWRRGLILHFPPVVLRLVLESFAFARMLSLNGAVAEAVHTLSAILAGGSFATDALFTVLVFPCDELLAEHPQANICLFIDDLTLHVTGSEGEVASGLEELVGACIGKLEGELELQVSRSRVAWQLDPKAKTVGVASSNALARRLEPKLRALGVAVRRQAKHLGIDYAAGKRVVRHVLKARVKTVSGRVHRYRRMGKKAADRLLRTGAAPSMRYGAGVCGATDSIVKSARRFSCAVRGEMRGRSAFARLQLAAFDVGALMATDPLLEWARAVWDGLVSDDDLRAAWRRAMSTVAVAPQPFRAVAGPAGAMVASALRLKWAVPSPFDLLRSDGMQISLRETCPAVVGQHALVDLRRMEACTSSLAQRIGGPPDLEPLRDFIATKAMRRSPAAESLRSLGEGGWWTQARLFEEKLPDVEDSFCRACQPLGHQRVGTLYHRFCECPATRAVREGYRHQDVLDRARSLLHAYEPLYQHGVPILPEPMPVPRLVRRWCGGTEPPSDFTFTGKAFTDGAMRGRAPQAARRAGWACILVDDTGAVIAGLYGPCPDPFPTSLRAELRAVIEILRLALPPLVIWVDNKCVVDGWARGKAWCCASTRPAADLWREFWRLLEDVGPEGVRIEKCKGHATEGDVQAGRSTPFLRAGNANADHFAGYGVDVAEHQVPSEDVVTAYKEARRWYQWLATLVAHWPADTQGRPSERRARSARPARPRPLRLHDERPHSIFEHDGRLRCKFCPRFSLLASGRQAHRIFASSQCHGAVPGRAAEAAAVIDRDHAPGHSEGRRHCLFTAGGLAWCRVCGCYGDERFRGLGKPCPGATTSKVGQIRRLRAGLHPVTKEWLGPPIRLR